MSKSPVTIFWFRRDLRLWDNAGLWSALKSDSSVLPIFIFDRNILDKLTNKRDARVLFIHQEVTRLKSELEVFGSSLKIFYGNPLEIFEELLSDYKINTVFANRDYEPYARNRDKEIYELLKAKGIDFKGIKDHVIFEKDEILKDDKKPYIMFTPYASKWKKVVNDFYLKSYQSKNYQKNFLRCSPFSLPKISEMGFKDFDFLLFPERKSI